MRSTVASAIIVHWVIDIPTAARLVKFERRRLTRGLDSLLIFITDVHACTSKILNRERKAAENKNKNEKKNKKIKIKDEEEEKNASDRGRELKKRL